jgi:hypothetical protein
MGILKDAIISYDQLVKPSEFERSKRCNQNKLFSMIIQFFICEISNGFVFASRELSAKDFSFECQQGVH